MAKPKPTMTGLLSRTENAGRPPVDNSDLDAGNIQPLGVGLTEGEKAALDQIAADLSDATSTVKRNAVLRFAVRWFIVEYRAGNIDLAGQINPPEPQKRTLRLPK